MDILFDRIASGAIHDSDERFEPPKCHPRTCIAVKEEIMAWVNNTSSPTLSPIMWLYGPAGAGKSAIAQSIAERNEENDNLLATFFFSRTVFGHNVVTHLVPTIAYQIAQNVPETRSHIEEVIERNPAIFSKSLGKQLQELVIKPLLLACNSESGNRDTWPKLIIIDGLDECNDSKMQAMIVQIFSSAFAQYPHHLRLLVSSRPELALRDAFTMLDTDHVSLELAPDDLYDDIRLYLADNLKRIRQWHILKASIPATWPSSEDVDRLVGRASGLFIYAATVKRYVESPRHRPMERLSTVLEIGRSSNEISLAELGAPPNPPRHRTAEWQSISLKASESGHETPFSEIDALYMHIFASVDERQIPAIMCFLSLLVANSWEWRIYLTSLDQVEDFLGLQRGDVYLAFADLRSLIYISSAEDWDRKPLINSFLHASLHDFLTDPARSGRFFIDEDCARAGVTRACMKGLTSTGECSFQVSLFCMRNS